MGILRKIKNNLARPISIVRVKFLTTNLFFKYMKNDKYEDKFFKAMKKKEVVFNKYFLKRFSNYLNDNFKYTSDLYRNDEKIVFVLWFQGEKQMPELIRRTYASIKEKTKKYKLIFLDESNIFDFIDVPEFIKTKLKNKKIILQGLADYFRMKLLEKYNCLWLDASILCLNEIPEYVFESEYYSIKSRDLYQGKKEYQLCPNFPFGQVYVLSGKNKRFYSQICHIYEDYFRKHNVLLDYFMTYYIMNFLYTYDIYDKRIIDDLKENNCRVEDYFYFRDRPKDFVPISPDDIFAKCSYKVEDLSKIIDDENTLLGNLLFKYK